ncbi:MFS transporter [Sphingobium fuliginis]|uniref:MFS transporter n=1 Tax=Sphingobium fuliginis ATCC 27551 TaxID=1208342 RepID=A0A5B8CCM3_SPHSA|nr:MFS transporter [Sphingobium fuliginis]QDC37254.1 MFS transporter [Sphingobium fuliginis ATCC 27551]
MKNNFRSLRNYNYRLWAIGSLLSYIGTWMQRVAQTWLVLTELTHNDATAVGIVTGLQFAPLLLLLPWTGLAADRFDRRKLLMSTQCLEGLLSAGLGILTIAGFVQLWHVYVFAFVFGCVNAFDTPASQSFASDLVGEDELSNAVALNATAFNTARLVGPGIAGVLIGLIGTGAMFLLNACSFAAVIGALAMLRVGELHHAHEPSSSGMLEGFRYVWKHSALRTALVVLFLVGTFALNFPLFISAMAVKVFGVDSGRYGLLMSIMAVGSIGGALIAAGARRTSMGHLVVGSLLLTVGFLCAAVAPSYWLFGAALVLIGAAAVTFTTSTSSFMQLESEPSMRGRVMALRVAVAVGATPIGAPFLGWIAQAWGPRYMLALAAMACGAATLAAFRSYSTAEAQGGG